MRGFGNPSPGRSLSFGPFFVLPVNASEVIGEENQNKRQYRKANPVLDGRVFVNKSFSTRRVWKPKNDSCNII